MLWQAPTIESPAGRATFRFVGDTARPRRTTTHLKRSETENHIYVILGRGTIDRAAARTPRLRTGRSPRQSRARRRFRESVRAGTPRYRYREAVRRAGRATRPSPSSGAKTGGNVGTWSHAS